MIPKDINAENKKLNNESSKKVYNKKEEYRIIKEKVINKTKNSCFLNK